MEAEGSTVSSVLDLWTQFDLPVLLDLVQKLEVEGAHRVDTPLVVGELSELQVQAALRRLEAGDYIVGMASQMPYPIVITGVTERALRAVHAWPSPEAVVERLLAALTETAEHGATPDERSRARKLLEAVGQDGRGVLVGALGSVLSAGLIGS